MSQPKRYSVAVNDPWFGNGAYVAEDGEYVLHSDYAALVQQGIRDHGDWRSKLNFLEADYKAEIARLTAENERLKAIIVDECYGSDAYRKHENEAKRLTAENERLRKAGDLLESMLHRFGESDNAAHAIREWQAAKEGRDAK